MILSDTSLHQRGGSLIDPFDSDKVQPASIDLRLSNQFRVFNERQISAIHLDGVRVPSEITELITISEDQRFVLHPGEFILGATYEKVMVPADLVGRVEGKSSLGRLGLIIHATAGFIDPGFEGRITLEMTNLLRVPLVLKPGIDICQISFEQLNYRCKKPYGHPDLKSRYQGSDTVGESKYGNV